MFFSSSTSEKFLIREFAEITGKLLATTACEGHRFEISRISKILFSCDEDSCDFCHVLQDIVSLEQCFSNWVPLVL